MKTLLEILSDYKLNKKAIPAFNIDTFEIYQAVEDAVRETNLPCIVQLSAGEDQFIQAERLFILVKKAQIDGLPIYLNMDHGKDISRLEKAANLGFEMLHFDGSTLDYKTNLTTAKAFIENVKTNNSQIIIEVEFNKIGADLLTDPDQALEFMSQTKADLFAVSIGNQHGADPSSPEKIDLNLLKQIAAKMPDTFLTLHGGSGIPSEDISAAIKLGVVKININTDLRIAFKQSLTSSLSSVNSEKIYEYFNPIIADLKEIVIQKLRQFYV
ncbi:MAG: class II fructose-bisphosphate aldolase [Candidatus Shapirobacteria bacterium]